MSEQLITDLNISAQTWVHGEVNQPSVLILFKYSQKDFRVYNPQEKKFVQLTSSYRQAVEWLSEDEYELVEEMYE